jgi:hypothetical protein
VNFVIFVAPIGWLCTTTANVIVFFSLVMLERVGGRGRSVGGRGGPWELRVAIVVVGVVTCVLLFVSISLRAKRGPVNHPRLSFDQSPD